MILAGPFQLRIPCPGRGAGAQPVPWVSMSGPARPRAALPDLSGQAASLGHGQGETRAPRGRSGHGAVSWWPRGLRCLRGQAERDTVTLPNLRAEGCEPAPGRPGAVSVRFFNVLRALFSPSCSPPWAGGNAFLHPCRAAA